MRIVVLALSLGALAVSQAGAARPPTVLEIKHYFRGCHVFAKNEKPTINVRLRKGDRIRILDHDVMDFDLIQTTGPRVSLGDPRLRRSETRLLVFRKPGLYRFEARTPRPPRSSGCRRSGPDNTLRITVRIP